jgi:hypothetical protein
MEGETGYRSASVLLHFFIAPHPMLEQLYRAPNVTGPYEYLLDIPSGGTPGIFEDGFLFQDPRDNWHIFFHTYTMSCDTPLCDPTSISGHRPVQLLPSAGACVSIHASSRSPQSSFSADGISWYTADVQPYFNEVNYTAGGAPLQMSTRERPKLLFDADGNPTHLFNGICPTPHCPPQVCVTAWVRGT